MPQTQQTKLCPFIIGERKLAQHVVWGNRARGTIGGHAEVIAVKSESDWAYTVPVKDLIVMKWDGGFTQQE